MSEILRTFDEWKAKGYVVNYGEKSYDKNEQGIALFERSQVVKIQKPYNGTYKVIIDDTLSVFALKQRDKVLTGYRVLCKCATKEDADLVCKGINHIYSSLMW